MTSFACFRFYAFFLLCFGGYYFLRWFFFFLVILTFGVFLLFVSWLVCLVSHGLSSWVNCAGRVGEWVGEIYGWELVTVACRWVFYFYFSLSCVALTPSTQSATCSSQ